MAATTNIICYPLTTYFNAMGGASWMSSAYQNAATYTDSDKSWGAFGYNNNGNRRTVVFKFTTPSSFKSGITNKKITVRFAARQTATTTVSGTMYYRISTTGSPNFNSATSQHPAAADCFAGSWTMTFTGSTAKTYEFTTSAHNFAANTTYYMWLLSNVPATGTGIGYILYDDTHQRPEIDFECTDTVTYTKTYSPALAHHNGYYSGAKLAAYDEDNNLLTSGYAYCNWAGRGSSYYRQEISEHSDWSRTQYGFSLDANTTVTTNYRTLYSFHSPVSLGNPVTYYPKKFVINYNVPRFACQIFCGESTATLYQNRTQTTATPPTTVNGYTLWGLTEDENGYELQSGLPKSITHSTSTDGKTYYGIYHKDIGFTFYCGGPTGHKSAITNFIYGKGYTMKSEPVFIEGTLICESDPSYGNPIGYTSSENGHIVESNYMVDLLEAGHLTLYSIYSKNKPIPYYPNNGESPGVITINLGICGKGEHGWRTSIDPELILSKVNWIFSHWEIDRNGVKSPVSWKDIIALAEAIDAVYAIWIPDNTIHFGNSEWKQPDIYYGVDGVWKPVVVRAGVNGEWVGGTRLITFTVGTITSQAERDMTWFDYCNSSYNTSGFMCSGEEVTVLAASGFPIELANGKIQYGSDLIIANGNYSVVVSSPDQ